MLRLKTSWMRVLPEAAICCPWILQSRQSQAITSCCLSQARTMRGYQAYRREPEGRHGMTADFLEADRDDGDLDDDGDEDPSLYGRRPASRGHAIDEDVEVCLHPNLC